MKLILQLGVIVAILLTSCAAVPLRQSFRMPTQDNAGTCPDPILNPIFAPNGLEAWIYWTGPMTDSLKITGLQPGAEVDTVVILSARPGHYRCERWAAKRVDGMVYVAPCANVKLITITSSPGAIED